MVDSLPDESNDDDSSSSTESSLRTDDGDQIRQHALQLLKSAENGTTHTSRSSKGDTRDYQRITYQSYQSYHDSPNVASSFNDRERSSPTAAATWLPSSNVNNEGGISITDVATLVFGCAATCIFEGYRAASNYLEGRSENNQHHYDVSQRSNNQAYNHTSSSNTTMNRNDGYQTKAAGSKEVMERGVSTEQHRMSEESWDKVKISVPASYQGR